VPCLRTFAVKESLSLVLESCIETAFTEAEMTGAANAQDFGFSDSIGAIMLASVRPTSAGISILMRGIDAAWAPEGIQASRAGSIAAFSGRLQGAPAGARGVARRPGPVWFTRSI